MKNSEADPKASHLILNDKTATSWSRKDRFEDKATHFKNTRGKSDMGNNRLVAIFPIIQPAYFSVI